MTFHASGIGFACEAYPTGMNLSLVIRVMKASSDQGIQAAAALIEAFSDALGSSKADLASSRCLSRPDLVGLVLKARDATDIPFLRKYSATGLIRLLVDAAVVRAVPLEPMAPKLKSDRLYLVGLATPVAALDSAEILQAHVPQGILCYFTAIELHGLTTQQAPHHHIARLRKKVPPPIPAPAELSASEHSPSLGSAQFALDGLTYYSTQRDPQGLQQTQRRQLNPYCTVTMTGLEQTLLDCLHRPMSAGGAAVVFEAWEAGMKRTTSERIIELAKQIGDPLLLRRAGYMIAQQQPDAPILRSLRDGLLSSVQMSQTMPTLLPGIPYRHEDPVWGLRTP